MLYGRMKANRNLRPQQMSNKDVSLKFVSLLTEVLIICVDSYRKYMFVLIYKVISSKMQ